MKKTSRAVFSLMLALSMLLGLMMPVAALDAPATEGNDDVFYVTEDNVTIYGTFKELNTTDSSGTDHPVKIVGDTVIKGGTFSVFSADNALTLTLEEEDGTNAPTIGTVSGQFKQLTVSGIDEGNVVISGTFKQLNTTDSSGTVHPVKIVGDTVIKGGTFSAFSNNNTLTLTVEEEDGTNAPTIGTVSGQFNQLIGRGATSLTAGADNATISGIFKELNTTDSSGTVHSAKIVGDTVIKGGTFSAFSDDNALTLTVEEEDGTNAPTIGTVSGQFKQLIGRGATSLTAGADNATISGIFKELNTTDSSGTVHPAKIVDNTVIKGGTFSVYSEDENLTLTVEETDKTKAPTDGTVYGKFKQLIVNGGKVKDAVNQTLSIDKTGETASEPGIVVSGGSLTLENKPKIKANNDYAVAVNINGGTMILENGSVEVQGARSHAVEVTSGGSFILGDPDGTAAYSSEDTPKITSNSEDSVCVYVNNNGTATLHRGDIKFIGSNSYGVRVNGDGIAHIWSNDAYDTINDVLQSPLLYIHGETDTCAAVWVCENGSFDIRGRGALLEQPDIVRNSVSYALFLDENAVLSGTPLAGGTFNGTVYWSLSGETGKSDLYKLIPVNHYLRYDGDVNSSVVTENNYGASNGTYGILPYGTNYTDADTFGDYVTFHKIDNPFDQNYTNTFGERGHFYTVIDAEWELREQMTRPNSRYQIPAGMMDGKGNVTNTLTLDANAPSVWAVTKEQGDVNVSGTADLYLCGRTVIYNDNAIDVNDENQHDFSTDSDSATDKLHTFTVSGNGASLTVRDAILNGAGTDTDASGSEGGYIGTGTIQFGRNGSGESAAVYVDDTIFSFGGNIFNLVSGRITGGNSGVYVRGSNAAVNINDGIITGSAGGLLIADDVNVDNVTINGGKFNQVKMPSGKAVYEILGDGLDWTKTEGTSQAEMLFRVAGSAAMASELPLAADTVYSVGPYTYTLTLEPAEKAMAQDETVEITATAKVNGTALSGVTYSFTVSDSGDTPVATVSPASSSDGKATVTRVGEDGTARITVTDNSLYGGQAVFTVKLPVEDGGDGMIPAFTVPISCAGTSINVRVIVSGMTASVDSVTEADLNKLLDKSADPGVVDIDFTGLNMNINTVKLPADFVKAIAKAGYGIKLDLPTGSVSFGKAALKSIADQTTGRDLVLKVDSAGVSILNDGQKAGTEGLDLALVLDIYLTSSSKRISDFEGGSAVVSIPFKIPADRKASDYTVYYVAADGTLAKMNAVYRNGCFVFTVHHFSNYVIAYTPRTFNSCPKDSTCPIEPFTDALNTGWYHDGLHYCLDEGIMNGTAGTTFEPDSTVTRAMLVTMLYRMEGSPNVSAVQGNAAARSIPFSDVLDNMWYTDAVIWAADNGLVKGISETEFAPNAPVTREQMATMIYRFAQMKGEGFTGAWVFLLDFPDAASVSGWADEAMHWCVMKGLVNGMGGQLNPRGDATRAQAATIFMRLFENVFCTS